MSNKNTELQAVQCATVGLQAMHDVVLWQMRNAARNASLLESGIPQGCERLKIGADVVT